LNQVNFSSKYALGNIFIFLAIVGNAYYNNGIKRIANSYSEMQLLFFSYAMTVILLTPFILFYEHEVFVRISSFSGRTWTGLILLTFFINFLSMLLFFKALKSLDVMQVALSNYMITFFGLPIAAIWLGESLSTMAIAGGILVLVSTIIITIVDYRMSHKKPVKNTL